MSIDVIFKRRSIRQYTDRPIAAGTVRLLLEAAMAAPSARNAQPWHFVVVTDRDTLKKLATAHPYGSMLADAALGIAVCGDVHAAEEYWIQDCSAATENILIAAAALDLGAVWLGCTPREDRVRAVSEVLGIPGRYPVLSLIALGHPAEEKEARTQYREDKVHWERF